MARFLTGLFRARAPELTSEQRAALESAQRPGLVLEIGGRPKPDTRLTSWWGGNVIAEPPRPGLVPLVQLRADELPAQLSSLIGADYLVIWIEADPARRTGPTLGLSIQRLPAPDPGSLAPVETLCKLDGSLACLPLSPTSTGPAWMLPHPDDATSPLPKTKAPPAPEDEEPVTIGGWPGWIGPSQWPDAARFVLEIRSSKKGKLTLPEDGSLYLFEGPDGWQARADGF